MDIDFQDPRHLALMSLHLLEFPTDGIPEDFLSSDPNKGFDLAFGLDADQQLVLSWNETARQWLIEGHITPMSGQDTWASMMLAISTLLPAGLRLQTHVDAESTCLTVHSEVAHQRLSVDVLALQITDVLIWLAELATALSNQQLPDTASATQQSSLAHEIPLHTWALRG